MSIARDIIALTSSIAFEYYSDIGSADHYLHKILLFLPSKFAHPIFYYYLCTRLRYFERRSNDGEATVKRQSKPTCSLYRAEKKPKFMYNTILYIYI